MLILLLWFNHSEKPILEIKLLRKRNLFSPKQMRRSWTFFFSKITTKGERTLVVDGDDTSDWVIMVVDNNSKDNNGSSNMVM